MVSTTIRLHVGQTTQHWYLRSPNAPSGVGITGDDEPAGPLDDPTILPVISERKRPRAMWNSARFVLRQGDVLFADAAERGDVLPYSFAGGPGTSVILCNPAHVKSIMTADPAIAPSGTRQSPLRPIVGADSVLTSVGARHKRQRALLMPRFHGKAVASYRESIERATAKRIESWPVGETIRLADLAQKLTLDVIMTAVFGLPDGAPTTEAERALHDSMIRLLRLSTNPVATVAQLTNAYSENPVGILRMVLRPLDAAIAAVLTERRRAGDSAERADIAAMLLAARDSARRDRSSRRRLPRRSAQRIDARPSGGAHRRATTVAAVEFRIAYGRAGNDRTGQHPAPASS